MPHVILHHHIFKNAGSTLDYSLAKQFPGKLMHLEDDGNPIVPEILIKFLDANPRVKVISSHNFGGQSFEPYLWSRSIWASHYAMVRRPLDRLVSIYKFFRREPCHDLGRLAGELDLQRFLWSLIERYPHMVDNTQVTTLANDNYYGHCIGDDDLQRAWARYRAFALCAPMERYDEAMVTLEYNNAPNFDEGLDLAYVPQNVSDPIPGEDKLRRLIGSELHDWLVRFSELDERLWQFASDELDRRITMVPQFAKRLADFRERCAKLQRSSA